MAKQLELNEFEAIYHRYKNMVLKLAYLTLGDAQDAEDAMQEVFIKVYRAWDSYNPERGHLNAWLHRITINQCISQRRRKSLPSFSLERSQQEGLDLPDTSHQLPERLLIKKEESQKIHEAMSLLDMKHRAIIALRYFDNLSYNEIAQILEIPLGTVKSRINTAIKTLRRELVEKEVAP
ncbi:RNA polymerase sigma factor [Chloroflexota bacterium]